MLYLVLYSVPTDVNDVARYSEVVMMSVQLYKRGGTACKKSRVR